jgi:energy-coupling factor transport system substrate-specific component
MAALLARAQALPQSVRFLLAGGVAAGVNWLVRFPLSAALPFEAAVAVAAVIGMAIGFTAYRLFVFTGSSRSLARQLRDFVLINLATMAAVTVAATLIRDVLIWVMPLFYAEGLGHGIAIGLGAVLNYIAHGAVTFQRNASTPGAGATPS